LKQVFPHISVAYQFILNGMSRDLRKDLYQCGRVAQQIYTAIQPWSPIFPEAIAAMRTTSARGSNRDNQVAIRTLGRPG